MESKYQASENRISSCK
uniref:Uncharacterized protein n=1 Tax=Anguilla anguilla TaxID=7936 RepID=A0A0E9PGW2_ANGAN